MSSKKSEKWLSAVSLTKFFSRITRSLSFSSKKHKKSLLIPKNFPKSVPVIRRHPPPPQSISKISYHDDLMQINHYRQGIHINMSDESDNEDYSRYSLQPNLSLFNISIDSFDQQQVLQQNWLDEILHSTKIEH